MTNEAVLIVETALPINFTVSNTVGIEKGALLTMSDPMTAATSTGTNDIVAGIAAEEKIASDGKTHLAVYREGVFKVIASGTITVGDSLGIAGLGSKNYVFNNRASINLSGSKVIGIALETAADEETFLMELKPMCAWSTS